MTTATRTRFSTYTTAVENASANLAQFNHLSKADRATNPRYHRAKLQYDRAFVELRRVNRRWAEARARSVGGVQVAASQVA